MNLNMLQRLASDHIRESRLARMVRRAAAIVAECNYAQRRLTTLMTSPDVYLSERDQAPADYPEFLFRASGALLREPAAGRRASGHLVG